MSDEDVEMIYCPFDRRFTYSDVCYCSFCYIRNDNWPNEVFHQELWQAIKAASRKGEQWLAEQSPETIKSLKEKAR